MIYNIIFLLISLYILIKAIGFAIYEFNTNKNKSGAISVIFLSVFSVRTLRHRHNPHQLLQPL